ncbi:MAG: DUF2207 domain-containing protein [Methanomassiliicoccaceae archaeon]|nr:DUF2207 domain-containing protein [Methanomassiliicoccaceae archaeon]
MNRNGMIAFVIVALFMGSAVVIGVMTDLMDDVSSDDFYKADIDIEIDADGNAAITETYSFRWDGVALGEMYITFSDEKAGVVDLSSIICEIDGNAAAYVSYGAGVDATYLGTDIFLYTYGWNPLSWNWEINAFHKRASSGEHTVTFRYVLNDVVARYADCVDLYYKVFTVSPYTLNDLTVTVRLPAGSLRSQTYIFGHGDPNGYSEFVDDETVVFKSPRLDAYTLFEIRVVSKQTGLYTGILTEKGGKTFDSIMAEEKKFWDDTERAIMLAGIQLNLVAFMVIAGILIFVFRIKFVRRNRPTFSQPYMREIPSVKPNISARLAEHYRLTGGNFGNRVAATVLNLAVMKVIAIEEGANKEIVFVSLRPDAHMTRFERSVHRMLFGMNNDKITLSEMKKRIRTDPAGHLQVFEADEQEFDARGYIDRKLSQRGRGWNLLPLIACVPIIPVIGIAIFIDFTDHIPYGMFALFFNFFLAVIGAAKAKQALTVDGEDERARTLALKRFYTDMTLMKERQTMELALWEEHLVYATALGVADKVIKELNIRLAQLGMDASPGFAYLHTLHRTSGLSEGISDISRSSYAAFIRASTGRVGDGGGGGRGGFSGGGGGGFSGGGGGGFGGGGVGRR